MTKPRNFSALVRNAMSELLPQYTLREATKGSAPDLTSQRPVQPERPLLEEFLTFSKLRWGIAQFDVHLAIDLSGPAVGGCSKRYAAAPLRSSNEIELRMDLNADTSSVLRTELPRIDRRASEVFAGVYGLYPRMSAISTELPRLYLAWRDAMPDTLKTAAAMLAAAPELQGVDKETAELCRHKLFPHVGNSLAERRLADFRAWLAAEGYLSDACDPAGHFLFAFWNDGRPKTTEEF